MQTETDLLFDVFHKAKEIPSAQEREQFLAGACGEEAGLRRQVDALLRADERAGDFLTPAQLEGPVAAVTERAGDCVGRYRIIEKIGEGGCGVVYLAEQEKPVRRRVALKIIKLGMDTRQVVSRFEAERQALALMDHPNIARVYDAGATETGRPYFVMEMVPGKKVTAYCDEHRLSAECRLQLFMQVCHAIEHAHQKGVIHRDIKPSNVLVMSDHGAAVPKVIDFGIAKATEGRLSDLTVHTELHQFVGTPAYMSPEQAEFSTLALDTRSDVYSLGVLLYELLTGRTPFDAATLLARGEDEVRRVIRATEPPKPSTRLSTLPEADLRAVAAARREEPAKLLHAVRGDIDWIVMTCLEKDRTRRYQSPTALASDIQRHLSHKPIVARPPSAAYRLHKAWRRNRIAFSAAIAILAALLVAVAALAVSTIRIRHAQAKTGAALLAERNANENAEIDTYFHRVALAHRELSADNLGRALEFLKECPERLRAWEWNYLNRLGRVEPVILRDTGRMHSVAFHPDGQKIAAACGDGTVKIWNLQSRSLVQTLPSRSKYAFTVAFRPPDGRFLAVAGADRTVRVWDWAAGLESFEAPGAMAEYRGLSHSVSFSRDGRHLIGDRGDGIVVIRDANTGEEVRRLNEKHEVAAASIEQSHTGDLLGTGSFGGVLRIWNSSTGELLHRARSHTHRISGVCFEPKGRWLATSSYDRSIKIWDAITGQALRSWTVNGGLISALALSPDGTRLASCGVEDKTVKLWDPQTGREILSLRAHTAMGHSLTFSPDGLRLASCSHDGTIRIWDATPLHPGEQMEARTCLHDSEVWSVAFSPDGQTVASGSWDNTARLWRARDGELIRALQHAGSVFHVAFSQDGQLATAAFTREKSAELTGWDPRSGEKRFTFAEKAFPFSVSFDPSGEYLLREGDDFTIKATNLRTGGHAIVGRHEFNLWGMAFSPDGKHLASGSSDGFIKLWAWQPEQTGMPRELWKSPGRSLGYGERIAFSPNGDRIVAGGDGNSVQIVDSKTGELVEQLSGHTGEVWAVAMDRQGRWIATAGEDTTIRVWDAHARRRLRTLRGHTGFVMSLAFSPDGRQLASGSRDGTVKFWDTAGWGESAEK